MRIIIISDIHDNLANLEKCLMWAKDNNTEAMICCGDVANSETLKYLARGFKGLIHLVHGNAELYQINEPKLYSNIVYYGHAGRFEISGQAVGLCHEPFHMPDVLALGPCYVIFYGHTHKPWQEENDGVLRVNPGNVAGISQRATFSSWDTSSGKLELHLVDTLK